MALIQLRVQQDDMRRQQDDTRRQIVQLERQQAEQIAVFLEPKSPLNEEMAETASEPIWMGIVRNDSSRPIRDVVCRFQPHPSQGFEEEAWGIGQMVYTGMTTTIVSTSEMQAYVFTAAKLDRRAPLIGAGQAYGFKTEVSASKYKVARMMVRFTDDVGLHWEVDPDLHLAKLESRSW